jgi:RNA polymerase sigma factor (sigma-70 family)
MSATTMNDAYTVYAESGNIEPLLEAVRKLALLISKGNEDVAQRAMIKTWRSIGKFDPSKGTFYTWAYSIVRNASITERTPLAGHPKAEESIDDHLDISAQPGKALDSRLVDILPLLKEKDAELLRHALGNRCGLFTSARDLGRDQRYAAAATNRIKKVAASMK